MVEPAYHHHARPLTSTLLYGGDICRAKVEQSIKLLTRGLVIRFMSTCTENESEGKEECCEISKSRFVSLIRQLSHSMRGFKLKDHCKTTQVHAYNPSQTSTSNPFPKLQYPTINSILAESADTVSRSTAFLPYGLPRSDSFEPQVEPCLKSVDFVESLAELYRKVEMTHDFGKALVYVEQYAVLYSLGDPKLLRRCLQSARRHAVDVHSKVVLSAWLRFERREDELVGSSALDCIGRLVECPKAALLHGYDPVFGHCQCHHGLGAPNNEIEISHFGNSDSQVCFCIGKEEINCIRGKIAALSAPLKSMLYGHFIESDKERIDFTHIGISVDGMRAVDFFSRTRRLDSYPANILLELLSFANRFCCEEMKSASDCYLASLVSDIDEALLLIDYALEERAHVLMASCLQLMLRELPGYLYNPKVLNTFCSSAARERLAPVVGQASFLLYYFLSHVALEDNMTSKVTVMLLERLKECASERWQKALALHQLGCVFLERKDYKEAQHCFEMAIEAGHVYSLVGVARTKFKQGRRFLAFELINGIISENKPTGWMYQERSLYSVGRQKILDVNDATRLDPTLSFPYKYRAITMVEESQIEAAIVEINRIVGFKVSPDCLELRAWFFIALEDYESAIRDIRALLTLEPNYMMFLGKMRADHLVELLSLHVQPWSPADCWMQLYDRWSSVDDIGSLAVIHQMLINDPGRSILRFRQSLLLLRLNCQKAAMRSLRLALNHSTFSYERLVYEGWILYDTGHREEALAKAEESISLQRSFEAFFLKAYALADTTLDSESSSYVIQLLEEALKCPSDGLRKGQALNNLGSIYVDCNKLDLAADCYVSALEIKHTRAHQGLARVYHLKNDRKAAYEEMTKLIDKAQNKASAYEKRSEYCDRDMANSDLSMATVLDPLRTYPYRYRAAGKSKLSLIF
ncbi:ethylene-overproduction protein 1-like isoform X2 [Lycium ferocissimum]|uniref:ethylene-overproduction protein 1-like isoform X2 n=1 Tax=Lycium ferocissimum TaxID=112874 RepID=UPI002814ADD3|nr:ethylene-overproduction protein 1-like isoform X2 [Lycium ferocissimum]